MIKSLGKLTLATVLAALVIGVPMTVPAQTNSTSSSKSTTSSVKSVHGKVASVDVAGNSVTIVNGKKFTANSSTVITVDDKKVKDVSTVMKGWSVAISYTTGADGSMTATKLKFGSTSAPATK